MRRPSASGDESKAKSLKEAKSRPSQDLKQDIEDDSLRTSAMRDDLKVVEGERDKENLAQIPATVVVKPAPRKPQFKKRMAKAEENALMAFVERGMDKEEVQMMKLALVKMMREGEELAVGMSWAHYPYNILSF